MLLLYKFSNKNKTAKQKIGLEIPHHNQTTTTSPQDNAAWGTILDKVQHASQTTGEKNPFELKV